MYKYVESWMKKSVKLPDEINFIYIESIFVYLQLRQILGV